VRFGCVELPGHVKRGQMKEMDEEQVQNLLNFAGMNEPPPAASADEEVEDEMDNIGNRGPEPGRERHREPTIDDDVGNRFDARERHREPAIDDDVGNRGTYGEGPQPKHERRPQQPGAKAFGFNKKRGRGHGEGRGNTQGNVQGGGREANGNVAAPQGNPQGEPRSQPPQQQRKHGHGGAPQAEGQGPATPAKPGRHRRHRNRNRNRNRGAHEARPAGGPATGGEREPG